MAALRAAKRGLGWRLWPVSRLLQLPARAFTALCDRLAAAYARLLDRSLERPLLVLAIAAVVLLASLTVYDDLGTELVPELIQGEFFVDLELPPGTHLELTQRRMAGFEREALGIPGIATVYAIVGSSAGQGGVAAESREHRAQLTLTVEPPFSREREEELMAEMRSVVAADPEVEARFGRPSYFSFKTPIEIELRGFHLELLRRLSDALLARLRSTPGFTDVESSAEGGLPELQVRFDRDRLAAYGLSIEDVATVVRTKVEGQVATEIQRQDRTIDIRLRADERYRSSAADLRNLVVFQQGKTAIPLSAVAEVREAEGPAEIRRVDGERAALVTANLEGLDLASAAAEIEAAIADLRLPAGFDWRLGGQQREMETSFGSMGLAIALAVFLVYLVMASQFESLRAPLPDRGARHPPALRRPDLGGGADRGGAPRRHRGEQCDHSGGYRQPPAPAGSGEARGHPPGGPAAPAADPDDHGHHCARLAAHGHRPWRGRRAARPHGHGGDRGSAHRHLPHPGGDPGRLPPLRALILPESALRPDPYIRRLA